MSIRKIQLATLLYSVGFCALAYGQGNETHESPLMFDSVVTVWSEFGHGTGFIVDQKGLILTNERVIGASEITNVQFDPQHKVRATLLVADKEKNISVLWANLASCPNCLVAPIAAADGKQPGVVVGDKVVAVSSPMGPFKLRTSGVVNGLDAQTITSDIDTNPWISGGPVFNSQGVVVGMTSAAGQTTPGRGPSKIVRIGEAALLLEQARAKLVALGGPPPATLAPVESADVFPMDGLEQAAEIKKFDARPYWLSAGDYYVFLMTPISNYRTRWEIKTAEEKRQAKHKGSTLEAKPEDTDIWGLKNWAPYVAEYTPVIEIRANSKLRETKGSILGRALTGGTFSEPWRMKFKTDFYKMKLRCGEKEIQPVQTGKIEEVVDNSARFTKITNSTSEGFYSYPPDAISPSCGQVVLELYSSKDPDRATVKVLDAKTVERIWSDFEPYRKAQAAASKIK